MGNITDSGANDDDLSTYLPPELRFSHMGEQPPVAFVITLVQKGVGCDCVGRKIVWGGNFVILGVDLNIKLGQIRSN